LEIRKGKLLHEGKTKKLYPTNDSELLIIHFKDVLAPSPGKKKTTVKGKGAINNAISSLIFQFLESYHIPTHFVKVLKPEEMLVKRMEIMPIMGIVWNFATKSLYKRFGVTKGLPLTCPIVELFVKNEKLKNPMITIDHACAFGYGTLEEMQDIDRMIRKTNAVLKSFFERRELELVDLKLEFGRADGKIFLADEVSLDTCHFYDIQSEEAGSRILLPDEAENMVKIYESLKDRICA
jgi:phosphoribosylaminoimidazole-succinocarboxamide synthase